ncbi:hypothetical protein BCT05_16750 [Vibrio breoganii]|nr:hypothetical protein BCT14_16525 [Vibrio breoganii]PMO31204.1 hypothetical protein BCT13_12060 [Vibrio breoganii]PMO61340.1 hypothetical protein BCT05_16750 [Vibrio breoganii]
MKPEVKLLVVALAELADNKGNVETTLDELHSLTCMASNILQTHLTHLVKDKKTVFIDVSKGQNGALTGKLALDPNLERPAQQNQNMTLDLHALAQEQLEERQANKKKGPVRLNRAQRKQMNPLHIDPNQKQFHKNEIYTETMHDWANGLLHTSKVAMDDRYGVWEELVKEIHESGIEVFTHTNLVQRLKQKISNYHSEVERQKALYKKAEEEKYTPVATRRRPVRRSAISEFEEKAGRLLARFDEED